MTESKGGGPSVRVCPRFSLSPEEGENRSCPRQDREKTGPRVIPPLAACLRVAKNATQLVGEIRHANKKSVKRGY